MLNSPPRRPSELMWDAMPPALDDLVLRCIVKDCGERPGSVAEPSAVFDEVLSRYPWSANQAAVWWTEHVAAAR